MPSDLRASTLREVAEIFDGPHATPAKTVTGPVFLGISCLHGGRLRLSEAEHLSEEDFSRWTRRVTPQEGDVVFSYETRLGEAALIPAGLRCCLGRRMGLLRPRSGQIDSRYLLYAYLGPELQEVIRQRTIHGSTVDRIPLEEMGAFPIRLPPLGDQRRISGLLGALDDKIDLNRRMNETLGAMARALFKSWFVDFDPVRAKAEGRAPVGMDAATAALFPRTTDRGVSAELPTSWTYRTVGDLCGALFDGPHATPPEAPSGPVFLGIRNLPGTTIDLTDVRHISEDDWSEWTRRVEPQAGDIVFTYEATLGHFALLPPGLRCCLGRRTALLRPTGTPAARHFLFHWFISPPFQEFLRSRVHPGATVDRILLSDFPGYPVIWPGESLAQRFETVAASLWSRVHANASEERTLIELRDTLLPRLLSGELRVRDADRIVEQAV